MKKISKSKEKKILAQRKNEIIMTAPSFINKILLLLNTGLVLTDCFKRAAISYGELPEKRQNYFTKEMNKIYLDSEKNGENVILGFYKFSRTCGVREITRIANILLENQNTGVDLWERLFAESENLWDERKRTAIEEIHASETKMSFPLGVLLISLIILTAAPALMQIS